jgi:hypothetical protein
MRWNLRRGGGRAVGGLALLVALLGGPSLGDAAQASATEETATRLQRGETVVLDQTLESHGRHYVGGVTYTLIDASATELLSLFEDVSAYKQVLPRTKQARLVGMNDGDLFVELRQGNSMMETSYTIRVHREASPSGPGGATVFRFWLDRTKPHGIEDAWGYFRVEPAADGPSGAPRVLLTYGILVDIGPGLVRDLFEEPLRALALTVPQRVRQYALAHFRSGGRA